MTPVFCGYKLKIEQKQELSHRECKIPENQYRECMEIMATGQTIYLKMA